MYTQLQNIDTEKGEREGGKRGRKYGEGLNVSIIFYFYFFITIEKYNYNHTLTFLCRI